MVEQAACPIRTLVVRSLRCHAETFCSYNGPHAPHHDRHLRLELQGLGRALLSRRREVTPDGFRFSLKVPQVVSPTRNSWWIARRTPSTSRRRYGYLAAKVLCVALQFAYMNKE